MGYRIVNGRAYPVGNIGELQGSNSTTNKRSSTSSNFKDVLNQKIQEKKSYTISKHAAERLKDIDFNEGDIKNIEKTIDTNIVSIMLTLNSSPMITATKKNNTFWINTIGNSDNIYPKI